eukprot:707353_1
MLSSVLQFIPISPVTVTVALYADVCHVYQTQARQCNIAVLEYLAPDTRPPYHNSDRMSISYQSLPITSFTIRYVPCLRIIYVRIHPSLRVIGVIYLRGDVSIM